MIEFDTPSLLQTSESIRKREISATQHVTELIRRIRTYEASIHAFIEFGVSDEQRVLEAADAADVAIRKGRWLGAMHGVGYGLKDMIDYAGMRTTAQSALRQHSPFAENDAFVSSRLRDAGAILLGKLCTDEFACGGRPQDGPWPAPNNPWNANYITGGSSSGSAAAVAAGFMPYALGTDTNGSIRNPSSRCGLVGMKPTYGRVSRGGVLPLSWSQDHVGPITRTVRDNALVLQTIAGYDAKDPGSACVPVHDFSARMGRSIKGLRIGLLQHPLVESADADSEQVAAIQDAALVLQDLGAELVESRLEGIEEINAIARLTLGADGFAVHARDLRMTPELFGRGARARLLQGAWLSADEYVDIQRRRSAAVARVKSMMAGVDLVLTASGFERPFKLSDKEAFAASYDRQLRMPFSLSGHPAMVLPSGISPTTGMPLSMQLIGQPFGEATMYQVAEIYERLAPWSGTGPQLAGSLRQESTDNGH